jgi:hypothetical protein
MSASKLLKRTKMRYSLMGNSTHSINSVRNLQRVFNRQYRKALMRDIWSQVLGPRPVEIVESHLKVAEQSKQIVRWAN